MGHKKNKMIMWYGISTLTTVALILMISKGSQGTTDWIDYAEPSPNVATAFDDDSDQYLSALTRDEEQEIHSPLITGYKYVSGGAGEGRQHLSPSGQIPNHPEVQTEQDCQCDNDHDECFLNSMMYTVPPVSASGGVLKRARRVRRDTNRKEDGENATKPHPQRNSFHRGQTLRFHVAKKSPTTLTS